MSASRSQSSCLRGRRKVRPGCLLREAYEVSNKARLKLDEVHAPEPRCFCWGRERLVSEESRPSGCLPPAVHQTFVLKDYCCRTGPQLPRARVHS